MSVFRVVTTPTRLFVGLVVCLALAVAAIGVLVGSFALVGGAVLVAALVSFIRGLACH